MEQKQAEASRRKESDPGEGHHGRKFSGAVQGSHCANELGMQEEQNDSLAAAVEAIPKIGRCEQNPSVGRDRLHKNK